MSSEIYNHGDEIDFDRMRNDEEYKAAIFALARAFVQARVAQNSTSELAKPLVSDEEINELAREPHIFNPSDLNQDSSPN